MPNETKHFVSVPRPYKNTGVAYPHALFLIAFCILLLIFFSPILLTGRFLAFGDAMTQALPAFASRSRLWSDALFAGFPAAADPETQFWYPLRHLLPRSILGWNLFVLAPYVLASSCAYGYQYEITHSPLAAAVTGITFALSGFMIAQLGHVWMIHTAAWLPLIIWAFERLRVRSSISELALASVAVANSALAGFPQLCLYSLSLAALYALFRGSAAPGGHARYYFLSAGAMALGLSIAAIQLIPSAEFAGLAARWKLSFTDYQGGSFPLHQSISILFPLFFGGSPSPFYNNRSYCGYWNFPNLTGFIGLLPLMLAALTLGCRDSLMRFWLAAALVAFVIALGSGTPFATLLFYIWPYNKFRVPARHFMEWSFALSVLAGQGIMLIENQSCVDPSNSCDWLRCCSSYADTTVRVFVDKRCRGVRALHERTTVERPIGLSSSAYLYHFRYVSFVLEPTSRREAPPNHPPFCAGHRPCELWFLLPMEIQRTAGRFPQSATLRA